MKQLIGMILLAVVIAGPAFADDGEGEVNLEEQARQLEFKVQSEMAEIQVAKARLELAHMERQLLAEGRHQDDDDAEEILEAMVEHGHALGVILLIIHILAAVWVYGDMKGRACASWIWIVLVLLGGLCAVLAYGVIRMGDCCAEKGRGGTRRQAG